MCLPENVSLKQTSLIKSFFPLFVKLKKKMSPLDTGEECTFKTRRTVEKF